jgi:hypothetical protein
MQCAWRSRILVGDSEAGSDRRTSNVLVVSARDSDSDSEPASPDTRAGRRRPRPRARAGRPARRTKLTGRLPTRTGGRAAAAGTRRAASGPPGAVSAGGPQTTPAPGSRPRELECHPAGLRQDSQGPRPPRKRKPGLRVKLNTAGAY